MNEIRHLTNPRYKLFKVNWSRVNLKIHYWLYGVFSFELENYFVAYFGVLMLSFDNLLKHYTT